MATAMSLVARVSHLEPAILLISIMVSQTLSAPLRQMSRAAELLARGEWNAAEQMLSGEAPDDTRNEALQLQRTLSQQLEQQQRADALEDVHKGLDQLRTELRAARGREEEQRLALTSARLVVQ